MTTINLTQGAAQAADRVILMTANFNAPRAPVGLTGVTGGNIQFYCTNLFAAIQGAVTVDITYDATSATQHENIAVYSVMP